MPTLLRSNVLVVESNSIYSLVPLSLLEQLESLLENHKIEDAFKLADQQRKKLEESITVDEDEAEELRYVYQRIGFQCFAETMFEDAGKYLFNGDLDPRLLISYYPKLRGSLFTANDVMNVFAGVAEHMPQEKSVHDIIVSNLVRNYSPHLAPNTRSALPTVELRKILDMAAQEMLMSFLRKSRTRRSVERGMGVGSMGHPIDVTVDTVLVKLYVQFEKTHELLTLLQEPNDVIISEVEPVFQAAGRYNALCLLYKQRGDDVKLLESWAKLIDGQWSANDIIDPQAQMVALLSEKRDRALTQRWAIWLTKRDPESGLKLLMTRDTGKRRERPEEDIALLEQIQDVSPAAAVRYLEYLVLQRRSTSRDLHMRLAQSCVAQILSCLQDDAVSKLWRAKVSSYASSRNETSFISYFASTTPDSEHKRARLKTVLILAGSSFYDPGTIREQLLEREKILKFELAIIDGKLRNHRSVLEILIHDLGDSTSAETYCMLGGDIIPSKVAQSIADSDGLQVWAETLFSIPSIKAINGTGPTPVTRLKSVNEELKKELLKILLEVYMGNDQTDRAAHLLNAQAINLDVLDVISLVPSDWPLNMMNSFLARSFRRTLHAQLEGNIVKNMSAGQNLEVKDRTWDALREADPILEEEISSDNEDAEEEKEPRSFDEKQALFDQFAVNLSKAKLVVSGGNGGQRDVRVDDDDNLR